MANIVKLASKKLTDTDLHGFLNIREVEVKRQLAELRRELNELRAVKEAIGGVSRPTHKMTHRIMVRNVLDEHPEGGTHNQIIKWVRDKFGVEIARTSISSHLSRLKSEDNAVVYNNTTKIWQSIQYTNKIK